MGDIINYTQPIRVLFSVRLVKSYFKLHIQNGMNIIHPHGFCIHTTYSVIFRDFLQLGRIAEAEQSTSVKTDA